MAEHNDLGKLGEELAVEFLQKNGYEILETNWIFDKAEIDIIAKKNKILIFVEVKTRTNVSFGMPEEFVDATKRRLIMKAAEQYIFYLDWQGDIRFDVVSVVITPHQTRLHHIEDAFY